MSVITISPSNQNIIISSDDNSDILSVSSSNDPSSTIISNITSTINTTIISSTQENNISINNNQLNNNVNINNDIIIAPISIPLLSFINNGRLTLESGNPLYSNITSSSTIYFTPYLGNEISIYDLVSNKWKIYTFEEISLSLSGMAPDTNYDIFCYYNSNQIVLEKLLWSSSSNRSVSLTYKDGVLVKSTDYTKKYLGTIRSVNNTTIEDSDTRRFVFNYYNRIPKLLIASDSITHTYSSPVVRSYRNNNTLGLTKVEFINGIENSLMDLICQSRLVLESNSSTVGISLDGTTVFNTKANNISIFPWGGPAITLDNSCTDSLKPTIGYHYLQLVQSGSSVSTFYNASLKAVFLC